ncbi:hypothetical protein [uncultured Roseobacter sp.]|uniref:hypothetical protein n=1 Tax=uncultured Roseobacter sp. TaxID=114847 RepID=UPI00261EC6ED|nr:hypothetical protein [uncultured Roseobacter sp.]
MKPTTASCLFCLTRLPAGAAPGGVRAGSGLVTVAPAVYAADRSGLSVSAAAGWTQAVLL